MYAIRSYYVHDGFRNGAGVFEQLVLHDDFGVAVDIEEPLEIERIIFLQYQGPGLNAETLSNDLGELRDQLGSVHIPRNKLCGFENRLFIKDVQIAAALLCRGCGTVSGIRIEKSLL